ncbi:MAG: hypothetical protein KIG29_02705 [Oscillospiraceae bacterium]|nr:hypothetical protein [Oscillospiraceae bacterium]MDD5964417.1 hypothetical protein [Oscillospiraceae bacterium]MDY6020412.1 hypothetical protein [Oscillospiraceae bacterium]
MYNRYLRNDDGVYKRIPMQESPPPQNGSPPHQPHPPQGSGSSRKVQEGEQFLQRMLGKLKLQDVDTADILLLLILFFLFEEKADDELLIALGLLLIL